MSLHLFIVGGFILSPIISGLWSLWRGEKAVDFFVRLHVAFCIYFMASALIATDQLVRGLP